MWMMHPNSVTHDINTSANGLSNDLANINNQAFQQKIY